MKHLEEKSYEGPIRQFRGAELERMKSIWAKQDAAIAAEERLSELGIWAEEETLP